MIACMMPCVFHRMFSFSFVPQKRHQLFTVPDAYMILATVVIRPRLNVTTEIKF